MIKALLIGGPADGRATLLSRELPDVFVPEDREMLFDPADESKTSPAPTIHLYRLILLAAGPQTQCRIYVWAGDPT